MEQGLNQLHIISKPSPASAQSPHTPYPMDAARRKSYQRLQAGRDIRRSWDQKGYR